MIQEDGGERPAALRAPEHRVQGDRPVVDDDDFGPARRLASGCRERECENERRENDGVTRRASNPVPILLEDRRSHDAFRDGYYFRESIPIWVEIGVTLKRMSDA